MAGADARARPTGYRTACAAPAFRGLRAGRTAAAADRNRIADHAELDDEEPPGPPTWQREGLRAGEALFSALVCRHGDVWAARALVGAVTVTVVGRGIDLGAVRLSQVTDLEPYLRGRGEMIAQLAERQRRQLPPVLEPAEGVGAARALADAALTRHARNLAAVSAGRQRRIRAGEGAVMGALWDRAVGEQARISGTDAARADQVVTLVVNQLIHLQEEAAWFTADPRLRQAAIDETLRHAVLGQDVPSKPAQQAWARYWARRTTLGSRTPEALLAELAASEPSSSAWLAAWSAWTQRT